MFDAIVELEVRGEGGQPLWTIVTDVEGVVDELLASGAVSRPEMRMPLGDNEVRKRNDATDKESRTGGSCVGGVIGCWFVHTAIPVRPRLPVERKNEVSVSFGAGYARRLAAHYCLFCSESGF